MITTKERSTLKKLAQNLNPVLNIGKDGLNENTFNSIENYLNKNELMKIKLLQNCPISPKDAMEEICSSLFADPVLCVGRTIIIYKLSENKNAKHVL